MDSELTYKAIKRAIRELEKSAGKIDPVVWCRYDGHVFKAKNLVDLRLLVTDYIVRQEIEKGCEMALIDEWRNAKIGEMPTWPSISGNCAEMLHMKIPPLPDSIPWSVYRREHMVRWLMDCQG